MGAQAFLTSGYGNTSSEAYRDAVKEAEYDYGHEPYNGTISTTHGHVMIQFKNGESLEEWADRVIDDPRVEKWGNCACVLSLDESPPGIDDPRWHFAGWGAS